jgi:signal peptidase II
VDGRGGLVVLLGLIVLADQAAKFAVLSTLPEGRTFPLGSMLRIRPVRRSAVAASALGVPRWLLLVIWLGVLLAMAFLAPPAGLFDGPVASMGLGAALGGAASNLLDRRLHGGVVDYVDLRIWPVFNLADAAILVGVIVALAAA